MGRILALTDPRSVEEVERIAKGIAAVGDALLFQNKMAWIPANRIDNAGVVITEAHWGLYWFRGTSSLRKGFGAEGPRVDPNLDYAMVQIALTTVFYTRTSLRDAQVIATALEIVPGMMAGIYKAKHPVIVVTDTLRDIPEVHRLEDPVGVPCAPGEKVILDEGEVIYDDSFDMVRPVGIAAPTPRLVESTELPKAHMFSVCWNPWA